jgi:nicotinamide mononucleotide transporter
MKQLLKNELLSWSKAEAAWLIFCCTAITAISLYSGINNNIPKADLIIDLIAALTGTLYALFAGKGKISCYFFGVINTFTYTYVSYCSKLYGEVMLNLGCYLPMMFIGFIFWRKHIDKEQNVIVKTRLSGAGRLTAALISAATIYLYALLLKHFGDGQPFIDSLTTVLSVAAMILTVKRCIEQWILWFTVNAASIYMWLNVYLQQGNSIATLLMWIIALANALIFFCKWSKEAQCKKIQG